MTLVRRRSRRLHVALVLVVALVTTSSALAWALFSNGGRQATQSFQAAQFGVLTLQDVSFASGSTVWAVGNGCTLVWSDSTHAWTSQTAPSGCGSANLAGVFVQGAAAGWAVGHGGTVLICSTNCQTPASGATWTTSTGPAVPSTVNLADVWAASATAVYAVGTTSGGAGKIYECTASCTTSSTVWTDVTPPGLGSTGLTGVSGSGSQVILVGQSGTVLVCAGTGAVACTTGTSTNNVWGKLSQTNIAAGSPQAATTVNGSATITSSALFNTTTNPNYVGYTISCTTGNITNKLILSENNSTNTVVVSANANANGTGTCTIGALTAQLPSTPSPGPNLASVDFTGASDVLAVGTTSGGAGTIWGCNGASCPDTGGWSNVTPAGLGSTTLNGVTYGKDANHAWAVGNSGTVLYCNANCDKNTAVWNNEATVASNSSNSMAPTSANLLATTSNNDNQFGWAVGQNGTIISSNNNGPAGGAGGGGVWGPQASS